MSASNSFNPKKNAGDRRKRPSVVRTSRLGFVYERSDGSVVMAKPYVNKRALRNKFRAGTDAVYNWHESSICPTGPVSDGDPKEDRDENQQR